MRVSSAMLAFSRLLSTKDTAVRDTPAALATSAMVTPRLPGPPAAGWAAGVAGPEGTSFAAFAAVGVLFAIECSGNLANTGRRGQLKSL